MTMHAELRLFLDGKLTPFRPGPPKQYPKPVKPLQARQLYAATHVVCDAVAVRNPHTDVAIDWDATLAFRRFVWSFGLGVAEAMDTAQRGMGLNWNAARELIRHSVTAARAEQGLIVCGAGTDQLEPSARHSLDAIVAAYAEQCAYIERCGGRVVLMASRALAHSARSAGDYRSVYRKVLAGVSQPVILHWLGDMFDAELKGYWGYQDLDHATDVCLEVIAEHAAKIEGIKISLLDHTREIAMRRRLPSPVRMYTGDDFHYDVLMRGDEQGYSDALLGIFDALAPVASVAVQALDQGCPDQFDSLLAPTVPLSRHIFQAPTQFYKTGIVFLAFLNGHQTHFRMLGAMESARSIEHLCRLLVLADQAGVLSDPELATHRMRHVLALAGIDA